MLKFVCFKYECMLRRKQKDVIKEDEIYLNAHKATVTVTEIYRRRYNKSAWRGYGVTFKIEFEDSENFKHRDTIQKSELGPRTWFGSLFDRVFNRNPPTTLSDFIIQTSHDAESKLNKKFEDGDIAVEHEVESAIVALE